MSETKHTPGRWWAEVNGYGGFDIKATAPEGHEMVLCQRSNWPGRDLQSIANGYLIAAAPDLLAALKDVVALILSGGPSVASMSDAEVLGMAARINSAIAKAEGR